MQNGMSVDEGLNEAQAAEQSHPECRAPAP